MKSLEYHGRLIFYPVDQVFSNHFIKRILLKRNFICMGALYTATPHKSVFTFWLKCSFKRANRIISLLRANSSKTSHQAWSKMPSPCTALGDLALPTFPAHLTRPWLTNEPQPSPHQGSYKGCPHLCSSIPLVELAYTHWNLSAATFSGRSLSWLGQDPPCYTLSYPVDVSIHYVRICLFDTFLPLFCQLWEWEVAPYVLFMTVSLSSACLLSAPPEIICYMLAKSKSFFNLKIFFPNSNCWKYTSRYNRKTNGRGGSFGLKWVRLSWNGCSRNVGPGIFPTRPTPCPPQGSLRPSQCGRMLQLTEAFFFFCTLGWMFSRMFSWPEETFCLMVNRMDKYSQ